MLFFLRRAPALTREEFRTYYLETHVRGPMQHFPRLGRYVVNVVDIDWQPTVEHPLAGTDAIAEMWFDDLGDFTDRARRYDSPDAAVEMEKEAAELFGGVHAYHVRQSIQRDYERSWPDGDRSPGVKMIYPVHRKPDISHEQFAAHWIDKHVPIVLQYMNGVSRYVTNVVSRSLGNAPELDGIVELHYMDPAALKGPRYNDLGADAIMADDVAQFLTPTGLAFRVAEYILRS
jgi:hypothetical protein